MELRSISSIFSCHCLTKSIFPRAKARAKCLSADKRILLARTTGSLQDLNALALYTFRFSGSAFASLTTLLCRCLAPSDAKYARRDAAYFSFIFGSDKTLRIDSLTLAIRSGSRFAIVLRTKCRCLNSGSRYLFLPASEIFSRTLIECVRAPSHHGPTLLQPPKCSPVPSCSISSSSQTRASLFDLKTWSTSNLKDAAPNLWKACVTRGDIPRDLSLPWTARAICAPQRSAGLLVTPT